MSRYILPLFIALAIVSSCKEDDEKPNNSLPPLTIPATYVYDSVSYSVNTAPEEAIKSAMKALDDELVKGRDSSKTLTYATLTTLLHSGSPSLNDITNAYILSRTDGNSGWLDEAAKASGKSWVPGTPGTGGVYVNRLFDEHGLEYEEVIEKCFYNAAMYNRVNQLLSGPITAATTDKIICLFGAHPSFANSTNATLHAHPDGYLAGYTARRDKNDGKGIYTALKYNLIRLKTAAKAGPAYQADQKAAIAAIRLNWEKASAATCINYLHSVTSTLSGTNLTDTQKASALHALSEAIGFVYGWYGIDQQYKKITDAQVSNLLNLFNAPVAGNETAYLFITDSFNQLPKLNQIISELKTIYGFSNQDIEDFKINWVATQNR